MTGELCFLNAAASDAAFATNRGCRMRLVSSATMPCCRSMRIRAEVRVEFYFFTTFSRKRGQLAFSRYRMRGCPRFVKPNRRPPTRAGARTHQLFLDTADAFVEVGYDAMNDDRRSRTRRGLPSEPYTVGSPTKRAVAVALLARYTVEIEQYWAPLIAAAHTLTTAKFAESADRSDEGILSATASLFHPSRCPNQSFSWLRSRKHLREAFVQAFQAKKNRRFHTRKRFSLPTSRGNGKGLSVGDRCGSSDRRVPVTRIHQMLSLYLEAKSVRRFLWNCLSCSCRRCLSKCQTRPTCAHRAPVWPAVLPGSAAMP